MAKLRSVSGSTLRKFLPISALLLLGLTWGGLVNAIKVVSQSGFPPFSYVFWGLLFSAVILTSANFARRRKLPPAHLKFYCVCGLSSFVFPQTIVYMVLESIPAGLMALLIATTPIITYLISLAMRVESLHYLKVIGVVLGFAGTALIIVPSSSVEIVAPIGVILAGIIPPACHAFYTAYVSRKLPAKLDTFEMSAGMLIAGSAIMLTVAVSTDSFVPFWEGSAVQIAIIVYHSIVTAVTFTAYNALIKYSGALYASMATYFVTLFGIVIGAYVHDEILPTVIWVAALLILGGLAFIQRGKYLSGP